MPAQTLKDAADPTTWVGSGVAGGGFLVSMADWAPLFGIAISAIVGIFTIVHLYRRIKISKQDEIIRDQEIALNKQELQMNNEKMNRRKDDPKD
jgi:hypothetical protein